MRVRVLRGQTGMHEVLIVVSRVRLPRSEPITNIMPYANIPLPRQYMWGLT